MRVSKEIFTLIPYKPGKPINETQREYGIKEVYKLASNENPLGMSPKALDAVKSVLNTMNLYPDPSCYNLIQKLSQRWNVPTQCIGVGNGSNEIIDILIRTFCEPGEAILTSQSAFIAYKVCAQAARIKTFMVPLTVNYKFDVKALVQFVKSHQTDQVRMLFIANPNNPTGTYINKIEIEYLLKELQQEKDLLIVFDEAYHEFVRANDYVSCIDYVKQYANVCVVRTFSKVFGLAGLRLGAFVAAPEIVDYYNRVRNPFNVNELAQVAGVAALEDADFIKQSQKVVWEGLDYFYQELRRLGLPYIESQGNFVLFDTLRDVSQMNEELLRRGVIMRPVQAYGFMTHIRLSVGTMKENQIAIKALEEVLKIVKVLR